MPPLRTKHNPRWHLVNLVPVWILQALTSIVVAYMPFFCFMYCEPYNKPTHAAAPAVCVLSIATIGVEAYFFAHRRLSPLISLLFQAAKFFVLTAQWLVMGLHGRNGRGWLDEAFLVLLGEPLLMAMLSLPFSVHLVYSTIGYVRLAARGLRRTKVLASEVELTLLSESDDGADASLGKNDGESVGGSITDELLWPPRGKFVPNWILQIVFPPFLCFLRHIGTSSWKRLILFDLLAYLVAAVLICSTCYGVYFSFKMDRQRLPLPSYQKMQIIKVLALYLLLDLVVLALVGWEFSLVNWAQSLFAVFALSVLFGSPFIAECVFAAVWRDTRQQGSIGLEDEIGDEGVISNVERSPLLFSEGS